MAKQSIKDVATTSANAVRKSTVDAIVEANADDAKDVKDAIRTKSVKRAKYSHEVRLNLAIPTYIKEYLQAAAYRESNAKHTVSITEYLCDLIVEDMEKHKDD